MALRQRLHPEHSIPASLTRVTDANREKQRALEKNEIINFHQCQSGLSLYFKREHCIHMYS